MKIMLAETAISGRTPKEFVRFSVMIACAGN
jgi:hypothetical protein